MAKKSEQKETSAANSEKNVWLIWGTDEYLVSRHARDLVAQLCPPDQQAFGLEIIEGRLDTKDPIILALQQCRASLNTVGFFGASKTVWLRDVEFLAETRASRTADVKAEIARLADLLKGGLLDGQRFVISASKVDRRSAFYKACQAVAEIQEFSVPEKAGDREKYTREIIRSLLREADLRASDSVVQSLIGKVGSQSRQLAQEVEKLRTYLGERRDVTEEDVRTLVSPAREAAGWDLADTLGERDLARSLETLRQLLFQNEKAFVLIMGLQNRVRELLVFRIALDQRWLRIHGEKPWYKADWNGAGEAEDLLGHLPDNLHPAKMNPWRAGRLGAQAAAYSRAELVRAQRILLDGHEAMLRSSVPQELLLETCLIKIIGKDRRVA
ncbi:MAG: DNA polymerase III subunit delta [Kiritimatiellae bacterium]|nr:DNA polymerase III subunit delta [Kiritimatiellia bacterium]